MKRFLLSSIVLGSLALIGANIHLTLAEENDETQTQPVEEMYAVEGTSMTAKTKDANGVPVTLIVSGGTTMEFNPNVTDVLYNKDAIEPLVPQRGAEDTTWLYTATKEDFVDGCEYYTVEKGSTFSKTFAVGAIKVTFSAGKYKCTWGHKANIVESWYQRIDKYGNISNTKPVQQQLDYSKFYTTEKVS